MLEIILEVVYNSYLLLLSNIYINNILNNTVTQLYDSVNYLGKQRDKT